MTPIRLLPGARLLPGIALALLIALLAAALGQLEADQLGRAWIEPMVLAILLGMALANLLRLPRLLDPGIAFSAKTLLDIAVALLGATLSWAAIEALGLALVGLIALVVVAGLALGYALSRALGLNPRLAMLVAAGNAICGNSAIAAVAPLVRARPQEVAAAIALTAIIGVVAVLALPFAVLAFAMPLPAYAVLTGLTVYAVPQVVAAAAPFGTATLALATLVKLARVVMLGPLTLVLALFASRWEHDERHDERGGEGQGEGQGRARPRFYLPWFIIAFAALAALRSLGLIPDTLAATLGLASKHLATIAMAALGLTVRLAALRETGPRVAAASFGGALVMLGLASGVVATL